MTLRITTEQILDAETDRVAAHEADLDALRARLARDGVDAEAVITEVARFSVAAPSWAVGTGGTRFGRFPIGGEPRTTEEKLDDVAALNAFTGANRTVSLHVPWDDPADPAALRAHADALGIGFDAMNSNTFQDNPSTTGHGEITYKFGSLASTNPDVRKLALEHNRYCIDLGVRLGADAITVWLADGTNHPGQANFRRQFERVAEGLHELHDSLPSGWAMFTEHKPYEPAFYSSVNADWGSSLLLAQHAGPNAKCLVDLGHHLPNTNIEQVVSRLAMVGRLGGFHFNDSKYGDDDLDSGSINPFQIFLVMNELVDAELRRVPGFAPAYMMDQSHNVTDPIESLIASAQNLQRAFTQALLVDRDSLAEQQDQNDALLARETLMAAFQTDVGPILARARVRGGGAIDPVRVYRESGYRDRKAKERPQELTGRSGIV
jgi:L-rhamnose isomerase/sugar isomerase